MKTAFITGGNQGIGFETARQLERSGYFVYIGCRDAAKGQQAIDQLNQSGSLHIAFIEIDITDTQSIRRARQRLEGAIEVLDVLINNAGIAGTEKQNIDVVEINELKAVFDTNVFGAIQLTQELIPLLQKSTLPIIVNVSSELGSLKTHLGTENPNYQLYDAYSASKTALNAFTVLLAGQLRHTRFKINSVTPGYTATNLNNYQGVKTPAEGARVIVEYATLTSDGPSGGFFGQQGTIPW
ncbi:SDR family oxidoreductase [Arachidicoccus terrestris]|uniref:SDR family oxidoreductase n=1 Tax=Arachidicoccus terrestris TaxID=2875539 RepID=UPI001CC3728E|nr:SDR family oxidoreductase [Arachidicoccus terrestris]UAY56928.1 SDR family oxidoreductase [Arachidicoccus terrestris]